MAGEDAAKAADKPAEEPAKELERLEEDDEFEEFETEGASRRLAGRPARRCGRQRGSATGVPGCEA